MADEVSKGEAGNPASLSSYEGLASTALVALANLIPYPAGLWAQS